MSISLSKQSYGKSQVCLSYVTRGEDRHDFVQLTVDVALEGDFVAAYSAGDNSQVVPTDTMKNSVYAIAVFTVWTASSRSRCIWQIISTTVSST